MPYRSKVCGSLMSVSSQAISLTLCHTGTNQQASQQDLCSASRKLFVSCSLKCLVTPSCFTPISRVAFFFKHKTFCQTQLLFVSKWLWSLMSLYVFPLPTNHLLIMSGLGLRIFLLCGQLEKQNKQPLKLPTGPETIFFF